MNCKFNLYLLMYKVISVSSPSFDEPANTGWKKPVKKFLKKYTRIDRFQEPSRSWRVYEKENLEKYFGKVICVSTIKKDSVIKTLNEYRNTVEYIRWYPHSERCTKEEYDNITNQSKEINLKYLTNSPDGFIYVQSKEKAFTKWQQNNVRCPKFFTFDNDQDFYTKLELNKFEYPYMIRVNNAVSGEDSFLIRSKLDVKPSLRKIDLANKNRIGINRKMMCIEFINTIDHERNANISFRLHVAGDKVISGYARVVDRDNWLAITAGSFNIKQIDNWIYYNVLCQKLMVEREREIVQAVKTLNLNHQGVDVVLNQDSNELYFLEVQPTYATGFSKVGYCGYFPPFYNPSDPELVKFILQNKSELEQKIPLYYFNWLDKNNHFKEVFKELKRHVWS